MWNPCSNWKFQILNMNLSIYISNIKSNLWRVYGVIIIMHIMVLGSCSSTSKTINVGENQSQLCRSCNGTGQEYFCPKCGKTWDIYGRNPNEHSSKASCIGCKNNIVWASRPCRNCNGDGQKH